MPAFIRSNSKLPGTVASIVFNFVFSMSFIHFISVHSLCAAYAIFHSNINLSNSFFTGITYNDF